MCPLNYPPKHPHTASSNPFSAPFQASLASCLRVQVCPRCPFAFPRIWPRSARGAFVSTALARRAPTQHHRHLTSFSSAVPLFCPQPLTPTSAAASCSQGDGKAQEPHEPQPVEEKPPQRFVLSPRFSVNSLLLAMPSFLVYGAPLPSPRCLTTTPPHARLLHTSAFSPPVPRRHQEAGKAAVHEPRGRGPQGAAQLSVCFDRHEARTGQGPPGCGQDAQDAEGGGQGGAHQGISGCGERRRRGDCLGRTCGPLPSARCICSCLLLSLRHGRGRPPRARWIRNSSVCVARRPGSPSTPPPSSTTALLGFPPFPSAPCSSRCQPRDGVSRAREEGLAAIGGADDATSVSVRTRVAALQDLRNTVPFRSPGRPSPMLCFNAQLGGCSCFDILCRCCLVRSVGLFWV